MTPRWLKSGVTTTKVFKAANHSCYFCYCRAARIPKILVGTIASNPYLGQAYVICIMGVKNLILRCPVPKGSQAKWNRVDHIKYDKLVPTSL